MVKFLLERPIAVLMAFAAFFIIGIVTYFTLPVSLLPDIAIPEITVQANVPNASARELENTVTTPLRRQLMQVNKLSNIRSETRDGASTIRMSFNFGTNTDLAFIEANEKIDAAMNYLPRTMDRPRVIKASATDIPVFVINLTLRESGIAKEFDNAEEDFLTLSEFASNIIKRRIEQLPEVAMVDITGAASRQIRITPEVELMKSAGISLEDLEAAIEANNIEPGSMTVRDGYYEYNIRFSSILRTADDVANIYINRNGRILQLKDVAAVSVASVKEQGYSYANGKRAVTLAVIKQPDENMDNMKKSLNEVIERFSAIYPDIEFGISRNQTALLDYTISNLQQDLIVGFIFICLVAVLFLGDVKSPAIIGLSMTVSLVICCLFFYLFHLSLNIISLAGLILALGMMIDSGIVVTENIAQYRGMGYSIDEACDRGTTEVIAPMLSSTLTTIIVFFPLVFMSGISGAIFYDQALAVTIGLAVSYFTGIMLLPVLYKVVKPSYTPPVDGEDVKIGRLEAFRAGLFRLYDRGYHFTFRHKIVSVSILFIAIPVCLALFSVMPKSRMPDIDQNELSVFVDWNENIHLDENLRRVESLFSGVVGEGVEYTSYTGRQQFLLNRDRELSMTEAELYFKTPLTSDIPALQASTERWLRANYPAAIVVFSPPETVFEKLFVTGEAGLTAELSARNKSQSPQPEAIRRIEKAVRASVSSKPEAVPFDNQYNLSIDHSRLLLYNVEYSHIYRQLRTAFRENSVGTLRSYQQYMPIVISGDERTIAGMMDKALVSPSGKSAGAGDIPLSAFVTITPGEDLKTITAGKNGEYVPLSFQTDNNEEQLMTEVRQAVGNAVKEQEKSADVWDLNFSGSYFSNRKMLNELAVILFVSIMLMYFILASQFESFLQPLIVLLEIPIDVAIALVFLWICGHSLNLMSAIGIVVTCSVIINDSILKLDAINALRKKGLPLLDAIHEAGRRRLRPIVMTALTGIFALAPIFFTFDMGSQLQKPLAISMISAMVGGTLVSLFIIPLVYWLIYRRKAA